GVTSFTLKNAHAVSSGAEFSMPVWSPDGSKLLVASTHGMKLHLIDLQLNTVKKLSNAVGSGFDASWSLDGKEVYFRYKQDEMQVHPEIKALRLADQQLKTTRLNPNGLLSASKAKSEKDVIVYINLETLAIEAETKDGSKSWAITHDDGQYYRPLLSPNQKQLVVHQGSEMMLYALDGSGFIKNLGTGIASSWSPDGKHVLAFMDESNDGHTISGSELYMIDVENGMLQTLTNTADVFELWPNWSPDGKHIAYEDARTGNIIVAEIVQQ
ncbi:MAG TPA: hypothetical protein ENJ82_04825, partial [Bacteroidetes bacterium]|nr:hypothetical protein [Bacteroidota bacterium]